MEILMEILISLNIMAVIFAVVTLANGAYEYFTFVNPKVIYKNLHVNWFGTMLLTIIFNILLPVISIPYWIYKLCTIGRK